MKDCIRIRWSSLRVATTTFPKSRVWFRVIGVFAVFVAFSIPIGTVTGFFKPGLMQTDSLGLIASPICLFIMPALFEEIVFRVLFIPHPRENASTKKTITWAAIGLIVFILWHPLNGVLFRTEAYALFTNPVFLLLALLLGVACTLGYLLSGSIWPSVIMHWITVMVWILFLGGADLLGGLIFT